MSKNFKAMSTGELGAYITNEPRFFRLGNLWMLLPLLIPWKIVQCSWATTNHASDHCFGIPMNLYWLCEAVIMITIVAIDTGLSTARNQRKIKALGELLSRVQKESS